MKPSPRIVLVHAMAESAAPFLQAFAAVWPEARLGNVFDDSLAGDLLAEGRLTSQMKRRFRSLVAYAALGGRGGPTHGVLFTCNAFGAAIDAAAKGVSIPVLKPNEAAFERALDFGGRIGVVATFEGALPSVVPELEAMIRKRRARSTVVPCFVPRALAALKAGRAGEHDRLIARAAVRARCDVVVLSQASMARAADAARRLTDRPVLTTPDAAVAKLRQAVLSR